ncbi:MAG: nickel pincer cofactor-dependent isomerase, group 22 [Bacillota bacterium]
MDQPREPGQPSEPLALPDMYRIAQVFPRPREADPAEAVVRELKALGLERAIKPGARVAITAGSRGIAGIAAMLRAAAAFVRAAGGEPRVVAAMGSHGGGTVDGQVAVLESLGITGASVGAPVVVETGSVSLGRSPSGLDVHFDRFAAGCDGIIVINRVKFHTTFTAPNESGLLKMLVVGLGKERGATQFHGLGQGELPVLLPEMARVILAKMPVLGGLAIVENAYEETALVRGVPAATMVEDEQALLRHAAGLLPRLPVDDIDLLIVDEMGKNFSGTGLDTKVIGRMRLDRVPEPARPMVRKIVVLDLSEASHGNANGLNLADVVTRRLAARVDYAVTAANCAATTFLQRAATPLTMETDRDAVLMAFRGLGALDWPAARVVQIRNTLQLDEVAVSAGVLETLRREAADRFRVLAGPAPLAFADAGGLRRWWR